METIVHKAIAGDKQAFANLYQQYKQEIFLYLLARTNSREDALDVTSDVFINAYNFLHSFKGNSSFRTWLYAICKHKLADYYLQKKRKPEMYSLDEIETEVGSEPEKEETGLPNENLVAEIKLNEVLAKLKPVYKEIIILKNINQLNYAECGEVMGISEGNARVLHLRAFKKIKILATNLAKTQS